MYAFTFTILNFSLSFTGGYLGWGFGSRCPERKFFKDLEGRQIFISYLHTEY